MSDKTEFRMNLSAIKKVDPYAKDIVDSSAHVAFYIFNSDENEWEKTDVEGAFFIYIRNAEPFHSIFVNNRLNTNSFVEPITSELELQAQPPFLLYRNERSRIRGFWFYNSSECDRIGQLVCSLIKNRDGKVKVAPTPKRPEVMSFSNNNVDIFTMLSRAQEDFNMSTDPVQAERRAVAKSFIINQPDVTSQSVMNFFAAAKPAAASEVPLFQRLLSNPVSVDQIEKQQRVTTPQDGRTSPNRGGEDAGFVAIPQRKQNSDLETPLAKFLGSSNLESIKNANRTTAVAVENQQRPYYPPVKDTPNMGSVLNSVKPTLMPPTMFSAATVENPPIVAEPLTRPQLLNALTYLINNDSDFMKKVHEAYLKSYYKGIPS